MTRKMWFVIDRVLCIGVGVLFAKVVVLFYQQLQEIDVSSGDFFLYCVGISTPLVGKISRFIVDDEDRHKYHGSFVFISATLGDLSFYYRENWNRFVMCGLEVLLGMVIIYFVIHFFRWIRRE